MIEKIIKLHKEKAYRPVVVAIIKNENGDFLIVQSVKGSKPWGFPQGGIDEGESVTEALFREIYEEVSIISENLIILNDNVYYQENDAPIDRIDKRGFEKGKAYFFVYCNYNGPLNLKIEPAELNSYKWVDNNEITDFLNKGRGCKRDMIIKALSKLPK